MPFALIDQSTVVILIAPVDENYEKMMKAGEEIHSRGAHLVLLTNPIDVSMAMNRTFYEMILEIPSDPLYQSILMIIPIQLLAYELAILKGHNPDLPRNLAKVVTVDGNGKSYTNSTIRRFQTFDR